MTVVRAYIALGSNMGDRKANIRQAVCRLAELPGINVQAVSCLYETEPVNMRTEPGQTPVPWFFNAVVEVQTSLSPMALLACCLSIESRMGRNRYIEAQNGDSGLGYRSRVLDLDILFYGDQCMRLEELEIPHPRLHQRAFVLVPMLELAPDWVHPTLGQSIADLHWALEAPEMVRVAGLLEPV